MTDYKALIVILFLGGSILLLAKAPACALAIREEDFARRRNLWLAITLVAFLSQDFWIFMGVTGLLLFLIGRRDTNPMALFFFLLFAVPALSREISGLGLARQFFDLSYPRLLALTVLLPAALALLSQGQAESRASKWPDLLLGIYILLNLALQFQVDTTTNTLRHAFYHCIDIVLPYYVASRSLRQREHFRDAAMSFAVAAMILAATGAFEYLKHWLLYASLDDALGLIWNYGAYLARGQSLRALATTGQPIALGYVMAVACGLFLLLRPKGPKQGAWLLGMGLLLAGLVAPLSRGPWLGAAIGFLVFLLTGPKPLEGLGKLLLAALIGTPLVLLSPLGDTVLDHLPFVGSFESDTVIYRQRLLANSLEVIRQNPFFGSFDYLNYLEELRQGQGIIDIVNTYLGVALASGLVGLGLFVAFFLVIGLGLWRAMGGRQEPEDELHRLGRTLFATLVGILAIIFTVSSITVIPIVYWALAGVGLAYVRMRERAAVAARGTVGAAAPSAGVSGLTTVGRR